MPRIRPTRPNGTSTSRLSEWKTPPPFGVGSRLAFVAQFLGRRLAYTYEIVELVPGERLVMRTAEGPFPMETTYTWEPVRERITRMTLRNRGRARWLLEASRSVHEGSHASGESKGLGSVEGAARRTVMESRGARWAPARDDRADGKQQTTTVSRIVAYTDGGCRGNPGGVGAWAFVLVDTATKRALERADAVRETTSNRME